MMKTATVRKLQNEFSKLSKWLEAGEAVQILKRGKPFAKLLPEGQPSTFLGAMPHTGDIPNDLEDSTPVEWQAAKR